ncbi:MAG: translocation/assembly module TamB domain-containing protein, partial [Bacteroidetes bacterium]|nr:translocation/assembly module TamB domain-containing protein [Bacteroidota bacterium]
GPMLNPDISFSILLPTSDPATQAVVQSRLSTEQELNRQIFALLVLNKFMPAETSSIGEVATGASNTTTEFVSSQLSNWLSQLSSEVDVGVNYRARDQLNSEELAVALTTQLFKDRLLLTGNFGVQGQNDNVTGSAATSLIGDFRLEYMITPDGRLRLKVFNETNQFDILNLDQAPTKQGVGLIFQREFDGKFRDTSLL